MSNDPRGNFFDHMPPKKDVKAEKGQQKALEKQKAKIAEDKTFGLKNKNKSKQVQKYIKGIHQAVKGNQNVSQQTLLEKEHQKKEEKKKKLQQEALLASLFKGTQNVAKLDLKDTPKTDPNSIKEEQAIDIYVDKRDKRKGDTMDSWDLKKLEEVIKVKHGSSHSSKPTDIVCKYFLDALEKKQYGWFWVCPNNGDNCKYRHSLPPGYVLNKEVKGQEKNDDEEMTLEESIEQERAALPFCDEKITLESFCQWKAKKEKERMEKVQRDRLAETKRLGMTGNLATLSGRDLFTFNPALFVDDAGAADEVDYQEEEDYWNTVAKENQIILDNANETAISRNNLVEQRKNDVMSCKKTDNVQDPTTESKIFISTPGVFLDGDVPNLEELTD